MAIFLILPSFCIHFSLSFFIHFCIFLLAFQMRWCLPSNRKWGTFTDQSISSCIIYWVLEFCHALQCIEINNIHIFNIPMIRIKCKILMVFHIYLPFSNPLFYSIKLRTSLFKFPCQEEDSHKQLFTYSSNFIPQFWRMWLKGKEMKYDEIRSRTRVNSIRTHFKIPIKM